MLKQINRTKGKHISNCILLDIYICFGFILLICFNLLCILYIYIFPFLVKFIIPFKHFVFWSFSLSFIFFMGFKPMGITVSAVKQQHKWWWPITYSLINWLQHIFLLKMILNSAAAMYGSYRHAHILWRVSGPEPFLIVDQWQQLS